MRDFVLLAIALASALWLMTQLGWFVYGRWGTRQPRTLSPRDGGLPRNIIPPRSSWRWMWKQCKPGLALRVRRFSHAKIKDQFAGAYVHKWISFELVIAAGGRAFVLHRWAERWAS